MALKRTLAVLLLAVALSAFFGLELKLLRGTTINPQLCPGTQPSEPEQLESCADPSILKLIRQLDTHTLYLFNLFKASYQADDPNTNIPTAAELMKVPCATKRYVKIGLGLTYATREHGEFELAVPIDDTEDWPGYEHSIMGYITTLLFGWLRLDWLHPVSDLAISWHSPEQAQRALSAAVGHDVDQRLLVQNSDHVSDAAISRWAFAGMAAHRLQCPGVTGIRLEEISNQHRNHTSDAEEYCLVDMMWLKVLAVRPGLQGYGATAYFTRNRTLSKIELPGGIITRPGDGRAWDEAKWAWKSAVLVGVTVRDHLTDVHLIAANQLTVASRENLNPDHPIRRLVKPFTYNTIGINVGAAKTLAVENSLVHRATGLTWPAMVLGFNLLLSSERKLPRAPAYMAERGTDKLAPGIYPFGEDWLQFYAVMSQFVSDYVDLYYQDDTSIAKDHQLTAFFANIQLPASVHQLDQAPSYTSKFMLKHLLTGMFTTVTGVHNQVGNIAEYLADPSYVTAKPRPGSIVSDVQSSFQAINIALSTASKQPMLLDSVDHLLLDDSAIRVWAKFRTRLKELSVAVDEKNAARGDFKCNAMNPKKMVFSVSI